MNKMKRTLQSKENSISTASLPDVVFMLLFFFMVTAVMRETELKIRVNLPDATEVKKLENKSLVRHIFIGKPHTNNRQKVLPLIQIDDSFLDVEDIPESVENWRSVISESDLPKLTVSLKVDKETQMGIITDVKQMMRKTQMLKINYAALQSNR